MEKLSPKEMDPFAEGHTVRGERRQGWDARRCLANWPQVTMTIGEGAFCSLDAFFAQSTEAP